jgi:hypothetical protein
LTSEPSTGLRRVVGDDCDAQRGERGDGGTPRARQARGRGREPGVAHGTSVIGVRRVKPTALQTDASWRVSRPSPHAYTPPHPAHRRRARVPRRRLRARRRREDRRGQHTQGHPGRRRHARSVG